jgi:chemotaxis response regulator CheB
MPTKVNKSSPAKRTSSPQKKNGTKTNKRAGFSIVGIGASAGGLETLETFFSSVLITR